MPGAMRRRKHYSPGNRNSQPFLPTVMAAIGAMAALMDLGLSIPGDVSVLGFDNTNLGEEFRPRLTCVSQPIHDLIVQSLELLYAGMKQAAWEIPPSITLPHSIKVRDSCRALDS